MLVNSLIDQNSIDRFIIHAAKPSSKELDFSASSKKPKSCQIQMERIASDYSYHLYISDVPVRKYLVMEDLLGNSLWAE